MSTETLQTSEPSPRMGEVGQLLRQTREKSGQDLRGVADQLKIRHVHLLAIEEGRYNDLPGATYAVGFVRAYAELLGLDSAEIIRRFRAESSLETGPSDLAFPIAVNEGGIPSGAVIGVAVILALIVYGLWTVSTSMDSSISDIIQEAPDRVGSLLHNDNGTPAAEGTTAAAETAVPTGSPAGSIMASGDAGSAAATAPTATASASGDKASAGEVPAEIAEAARGKSTTATTAPATPAPAAQATPAQTQTPAQTPAQTQTQPQTPATANAPVAGKTAEKPAEKPGEKPADKPAESSKPAAPLPVASAGIRVVLQAQEDAWVQVRDNTGVIMGRLMKSGETYEVPNRPGLSLRTGNAGGTRLIVDGQMLPPLGRSSEVIGSISLDPEKLKALRSHGE